MTMDNLLLLDEYTVSVTASNAEYDLFLLVKPDAELDATFVAYDCDAEQFVTVHGDLFHIYIHPCNIFAPTD
jgi:hypothetical protein